MFVHYPDLLLFVLIHFAKGEKVLDEEHNVDPTQRGQSCPHWSERILFPLLSMVMMLRVAVHVMAL